MWTHPGKWLAIATLTCVTAFGQTAEKQVKADPGVVAIRLIDRDEVRASRIEIQAGAVRRVHAHTDVLFHLFVGIKGTVQLTMGSDKPVEVKAGQAYFMKMGTMHGFKNATSEPAVAMEIFIKSTASPVAQDALGTVALLLKSMADAPLQLDAILPAPSLDR